MGESGHALGLRDRKKIKTRDAVRRETMRLVEAFGWSHTTIEQIAEAADIAPSTFFRYFPTKEAVLLTDDLETVTLEALARQPTDLPPLKAFRNALAVAAAKVSENDWEFERARQRMVFSIAELKAAQFDIYRRSSVRVAEAESRRHGTSLVNLETKVFYGAVVGALLTVLDQARGRVEADLFRALDFIEAGMPL